VNNLNNVRFFDLLPPSLKQDSDAIATSNALDSQFNTILNNIGKVLVFVNIDNLGGDILDTLAIDIHVDYYDSALPNYIKRSWVKNSLKSHFYKGTVGYIDNLVSEIFGYGEVVEWWRYGGKRCHFKVETTNIKITEELVNKFNLALNSAKNIRSKLDSVDLILSANLDINYGFRFQTGEIVTIRQIG